MRAAALVAISGGFLIAGIYAAGVRGLADGHYFVARMVLADATKARRLPEGGELAAAQQALGDALRLEPSNPLFVEQLGRSYEVGALRLRRDDPQARRLLQRSLAQYRKAALMRPVSPHVWANIAVLKLRLDDMDFEFYGALERANRLGSWEPAVQATLADVGFASWRLLARPGKRIIAAAVGRGMVQQEKEMRRIAALHGTLPLFCREEPALRARASGLCVKR